MKRLLLLLLFILVPFTNAGPFACMICVSCAAAPCMAQCALLTNPVVIAWCDASCIATHTATTCIISCSSPLP